MAAAATLTTKRYYSMGSTVVAVRDSAGSGSLNYLLGDQLGSTTVSVNSAGGTPVVQRYLPYGAPRSTSGTPVTDRGWIGQTKDESTGLQYLNARYYDPTAGRFAASDPLADMTRPATLDAYGYSGGNPITNSDPTGLIFVPDGGYGYKGKTAKEAKVPATPAVTTFWYLAVPGEAAWTDDVLLDHAAREWAHPDGSGGLDALADCAAVVEGACERHFVTVEDELLSEWFALLQAIEAERPTIAEELWDNRWNIADTAVLATCLAGATGSCVKATIGLTTMKSAEIVLSDRSPGEKGRDLLYTAVSSAAYLLPGVAAKSTELIATGKAITLTQAPASVVRALRISTAGPGTVCVAAGSRCTSPGIPTTG